MIAPHPGPVLQVGIVGHRALPDAAPGVLAEVALGLMRRIRAVAAEAFIDRSGLVGKPIDFRCLSSLAEGADTILADAALTAEYGLLCPLPYAPEVYERDFAEGRPRDDFRRLLGRASAVYEIDGVPDGPDAYKAAGRLLLEQSDVLIAVWNGLPERGVGGTGQMIREARRADIPIIVIASEAPHAIRAIGHKTEADLAVVLADWLSRTLTLPTQTTRTKDFMAVYEAERLSGPGMASRFNHLLEETLLIGSRHKHPAMPPRADAITPAPAIAAAAAEIERQIGPHLEAADHLAIRYAELYRLASNFRYLSALPVTVMAVLAFDAPPLWSRIGFGLQLAVMIATLLVAWADSRGGWHRRFLDYRYIAERLRQSKVLALFGSTAAMPRPFERSAEQEQWVDWHLRTVVRSMGLVSAKADLAFMDGVADILIQDVDQQLEFYEAHSARFRVLSDRLKSVGMSFFVAGMAFTIIRLGLAVSDVSSGISYKATAEFALVLPALALVFFGLRSQNEYGRLSQRYDVLASKLVRIRDRIPLHLGSRVMLQPIALDMVSVMLAEVSEWRVLIKARDLSPC